MTYVDGLKSAEAVCAEQSKRYVREAANYDTDEDKANCLTSALAALECAIAIKRLVEQAERAEMEEQTS